MTKRMLIDAGHSEETRLAILNNNKLEEFMYESAMRRPLKGNIFLAKVTRVEPSLQAAFVNYGGNRHGFLPFSEIHPDYFRIPVADQEEFQAMQREQLEEHDKWAEVTEEEIVETDDADAAGSDDNEAEDDAETDAEIDADGEDTLDDEADGNVADAADDESEDSEEASSDSEESGNDEGDDNKQNRGRGGRGRHGRGRGGRDGRGGRGRSAHRSKRPENFGDDEAGQQSRFRFNLRRKYKIQEVIKRGQIMLIQVSREERGNKGAAVSTYLSLPGRYCVLMPNSPRGGGVSRKISNYKDRSKMKELLGAMEVPAGMSAIVRTAGLERTKTEVKRDLDYLMKLWNSIRELTLKSSAPAEVYQEADLVKRAMRDFYTRDIDEVLVAGTEGHKTAKDFMKMLMPSHAKKITEYTDTDIPLFHRYQVEDQIAAIGETEVTLPSGGYLVINPTEALVSIDVNSGRSTKERNIEGTALKTNLEAAEEVARQLRLRDLGGLVVIDFIDMEDRRNNGKVERKMRDALADDKARVQVGRISSFGLMELSRQRLNASLSEAQYETCSTCEGRGLTRTADSASLLVLRAIESEGVKDRAAEVIVHVPPHVALFLLNHKRKALASIEERFELTILIRVDEDMPASKHRVEVSKPSDSDDAPGDEGDNKAGDNKASAQSSDDNDNDEESGNNRNRRGGRGGRNRGGRGRGRNNRDRDDNASQDDSDTSKQSQDKSEDKSEDKADSDAQTQDKPRPRRGRKKQDDDAGTDASSNADTSKDSAADANDKPKPRRGRKKKDDAADANADKASDIAEASEEKEKAEKPKKRATKKKVVIEEVADAPAKAKDEPKAASSPEAKSEAVNDDSPTAKAEYEVVNEAPKKKKKGWWSKGSE